MLLQDIKVFLVVGSDRSWIEAQSRIIEQKFAVDKSFVTRVARIPEYPEFIKTMAGTNTDIERQCFNRVLFILRNFREECAENRKLGVLIIDGYIVGQGLVERLIAYMNLSTGVDQIEQVIAPQNTNFSLCDAAKHFPPYCGVYHYKNLSQIISKLARDYDYLLILAPKHMYPLMLYSRNSGEYFLVFSHMEARKDGKTYKALAATLASTQTNGKDAIFELKTLANWKFACSKMHGIGTHTTTVRPNQASVKDNLLEIDF
jgi:hypothetical protein